MWSKSANTTPAYAMFRVLEKILVADDKDFCSHSL